MACVSSALIVGGGIAGLSAAIALARQGVRCEVLEIADAPLGASLGLSGRATDALVELGVYQECHDTGRPFTADSNATSIRDAKGELLHAGAIRPQWPGAKPNVAVYRPVFLQVLADTAQGLGVTLRQKVTVEAIESDDHAALATLTTGEQRRVDMVIGADGIGSRTRSLLFPDAPKPAYAGQLSIRWMAGAPAVEPEGWYYSPLGRVGFYYLPHQRTVYVPAVIVMPERKRLSDAEVYTVFEQLMDSYTAPAMVELRRRLTPESDLIGTSFEWVLVPEPWYRGRTILIGDAAHATTAHMGMGGGMALEDAVVLGQCIGGASSLNEAFETFMQRRFARVRTVVETSVKLSQMEQQHAPPDQTRPVLAAGLHALAEPY